MGAPDRNLREKKIKKKNLNHSISSPCLFRFQPLYYNGKEADEQMISTSFSLRGRSDHKRPEQLG